MPITFDLLRKLEAMVKSIEDKQAAFGKISKGNYSGSHVMHKYCNMVCHKEPKHEHTTWPDSVISNCMASTLKWEWLRGALCL